MQKPYAYIKNVCWFHHPNRLEAYLADVLPPKDLISAAFVFVFDENKKLLLTDVIKRGWDIPGGGLEPGEEPENGARRELMEETGSTAQAMKLIGFKKLIHEAKRPEGYKRHHPISYQIFYVAKLGELSKNYDGDQETRARKFCSEVELADLDAIQFEFNHIFYDEARRQIEYLE